MTTTRFARAAACMAAIALYSHGVFAQADPTAIGAVIAPAGLMSAYTCSAYAETFFIAPVKDRLKASIASKGSSATEVKRIFQAYDDVLARMCQDLEPHFISAQREVHASYARQWPSAKSEQATALTSLSARNWGTENAQFLASTAPLLQLIALAREVAPELLDSKPPQTFLPLWRVDSQTYEEVEKTSVGMAARLERRTLIHFLNDKGFAQLAPRRYNLERLAKDEARLRKDAMKLRATSPYWFNDNASDLVRMHFGTHDAMRAMNLVPVFQRYESPMSQVGK